MRVVFSPAAKLDVTEIHDHIARESPKAAKQVIRMIRHRIQSTIAEFPECGSPASFQPGLRFHTIGNYVVFYFVTHRIEKSRIIHGARDLGVLLSEPKA